MDNPLASAVEARQFLTGAEGDMMFEIAGEAAFEPFDDALMDAVLDLIENTAFSLDKLSPRARQARLNLIWRDFVVEQKQQRAIRSQIAVQPTMASSANPEVSIKDLK